MGKTEKAQGNVTHEGPRKPVPDRYGMEIKAGDTVYLTRGKRPKLTVVGFDHEGRWGDHCVVCRNADGFWGPYHPDHLAHGCPDSWEHLEKDASRDCCGYFDDGHCTGCPGSADPRHIAHCTKIMVQDIVLRAKALAGVVE